MPSPKCKLIKSSLRIASMAVFLLVFQDSHQLVDGLVHGLGRLGVLLEKVWLIFGQFDLTPNKTKR